MHLYHSNALAIRLMVKKYATEMTDAAIARKFGVDRARVKKARQRLGIRKTGKIPHVL